MVLYKKVILKNFIKLQKNKAPLHLFSHLEVIYKKGVPKNLAKFAGKHLCQGLFLNKVAGLRRYEKTLLKKRLWHRCFHVNFTKLLRTPFYETPPVVDSGFSREFAKCLRTAILQNINERPFLFAHNIRLAFLYSTSTIKIPK